MRLPALGVRDRRALVFGTVTIVAIVVAARGIPPLRSWSAASVASAGEALAEAERAERGVKDGDELRDSMRTRGARFIALAPALLDGPSVASAGATLASLVSGAAATADGRLGAVQVRVDNARRTAAQNTFVRVSVRADLTADVRGLSRFLVALERGPTLLAIRELSVTQPEPGSASDRPEMLRVEVVVEGLALAREGTSR